MLDLVSRVWTNWIYKGFLIFKQTIGLDYWVGVETNHMTWLLIHVPAYRLFWQHVWDVNASTVNHLSQDRGWNRVFGFRSMVAAAAVGCSLVMVWQCDDGDCNQEFSTWGLAEVRWRSYQLIFNIFWWHLLILHRHQPSQQEIHN